MDLSFVFGYGSLLERGKGTPCRLDGHRRRWGVAMDNRRTIAGYKYFLEPGGGRPDVFVSFLDAVPEPGASCIGLAFPVDTAALGELDARERYEAGVRAGTAVVSRAYAEGVRAGFAAFGLDFDTEPEVPVRDLELVWIPGRTSTAAG